MAVYGAIITEIINIYIHYRGTDDMNREYTDTGIRINRGQRRWHKYGSKILAACIAAAAIIAIIAIAASVGRGGTSAPGNTASGGGASSGNSGESAAAVTTASSNGETSEGTSSAEGTGESTETTTTASSGSVKGGALTGEPAIEEFTSDAFYEDAAFIGDVFVYGIDEYEYVPSSNLYSATFMTAAKAKDLTEDISAGKPAKILVMLGFDDDNLAEDRTAQASADSIIELLKALKESNPNAQIYAVSELPVSEAYENSGEDYIIQSDLDEINSLVKKAAEAEGMGYIDVAEVLKEGNYLSTEYTNDGCHVKKEYYPFILNGIAKTAK